VDFLYPPASSDFVCFYIADDYNSLQSFTVIFLLKNH